MKHFCHIPHRFIIESVIENKSISHNAGGFYLYIFEPKFIFIST